VVLTLVDLGLDAGGARHALNAERMYGTGNVDRDGGGTGGAYSYAFGKLNARVGG
jgi:hypothetical protein